MTTDTSEKGLETLIMRHMTGTDGLAVEPNMVAGRPPPYGGTGYTAGSPKDFDRSHALDVPQLFAFLRTTQPDVPQQAVDGRRTTPRTSTVSTARLSSEIAKRGVIDVLRKGVDRQW